MLKHEEKKCPRCAGMFECKVGSVGECQCAGISFTDEERAFIGSRYTDCLCRNCLLELKDKNVMFREKFFTK